MTFGCCSQAEEIIHCETESVEKDSPEAWGQEVTERIGEELCRLIDHRSIPMTADLYAPPPAVQLSLTRLISYDAEGLRCEGD